MSDGPLVPEVSKEYVYLVDHVVIQPNKPSDPPTRKELPKDQHQHWTLAVEEVVISDPDGREVRGTLTRRVFQSPADPGEMYDRWQVHSIGPYSTSLAIFSDMWTPKEGAAAS